MLSWIKNRYADRNTVIRALAHGMLSGLSIIFIGHLGFLVGPAIEAYQWKTDPAYDIKDGIFDLSEHWAGAILIGWAWILRLAL